MECYREFINQIDKLHTTSTGSERIKNNLNLYNEDIIEWCIQRIKEDCFVTRKGKNYYVVLEDCTLTINASTYTIITAHKEK